MSNDRISFTKYIDMQNCEWKWFFCKEDAKVSDDDLEYIRPLSEKYSSLLWSRYVSKNYRHLALTCKDENEWPNLLERVDYNWQVDWNEKNIDGLKNALEGKVVFEDEDMIIFFWMKERGVETKWEVFIKNWINFLFDDEGPIIISLEKDDSVRFNAYGSFFVGRRKCID